MRKKFVTENTKAVAARERKKQAKDELNAKKEKEIEDAKWRDDGKQVIKKQQKKEAEDRKRQEQIQRKVETKVLLEQELTSITSNKPVPAPKITRAQITTRKEPKEVIIKPQQEPIKKNETLLDDPLIQNINKLEVDGEEARTIDEAINLLSFASKSEDKHPEKRMKALYTAFEHQRLEALRAENPTLRLSQLKQMIFKEWQKSPSNPLCKE